MRVLLPLLGAVGAARRRLDAACVDDASWHIKNSPAKDCGLLSGKPQLCAKKSADKQLGYEACPFACGLCDSSEEDSTSWYATGKTKNDCDWIGKRPEDRCGKKDEATKVEAWCVRAPGATAGDALRAGEDDHGAGGEELLRHVEADALVGAGDDGDARHYHAGAEAIE
ncbi:hypothetical protein JL722_2795 [Aureococcus anophagefferens]|nr:hypothetical protein JL722_2795 [Aureococcus anophagefferens]